jgi:hypothetical protein
MVRGADPSVVLPLVKVTIPDGAALPVAALIVAVTRVVPLCAIAAGLAVTVVAVFTGGAVTVTVTEPVEPAKLPFAEYVAVMVLLPAARLLPLTVSAAVPAADRVAVPREVVPRANTTLPAGAAVPDAGFTVAVSCVVAPEPMLAGLAVTAVVVPASGETTLTVTVAAEPAKLLFPA